MKCVEMTETLITTCDFCMERMTHQKQCRNCGKDMCSKCQYQSSGFCKECWNKNEIISEVHVEVGIDGDTYGTRNCTNRYLDCYQPKWNDLLVRFEGKKFKITFEEIE